RPLQFSFIMGVLGGIRATAENLAMQAREAPPDSTWEVIGISHEQWKMVGAALSLGGNVRVGLEDNFYLDAAGTQMARSNGDLGVMQDRIEAVGDLRDAQARRRIDAKGRMLAPGFIDLLGQSEDFALVDSRVESKIRQGITTEITGEGWSEAPVTPAILEEAK